ncbi:transposase [Mycobacterium sp.]|jgi:putative transposase|uniref:transposase n=1 Tax=Mycobacterium sp. TaxID=1785 RepID=UPI0033402921
MRIWCSSPRSGAVFTDEMLTFCEHTTPAECAELDVELVEFNGEADHLHLRVACPAAT